MTVDEYQALIPYFCSYRTTREHFDGLLWCWGITHGHVQQARGVEGPQYCHTCAIAIKAGRLKKLSKRKWNNEVSRQRWRHSY